MMKTRYFIFSALLSQYPLHALAQSLEKERPTLKEVTVIANNPIGDTGIPLEKFPGNVQTLSVQKLPAGDASLGELLNASLGSISVNDTQGNPFQMDINYRGFTASSILGTPQGVSVYLDGMRINEPFGDVVSWDLLPRIAIDTVTVIPGSNPVYGLNTLGGAMAIRTKTGISFTGSQAQVGLGSFGRKSLDVEHGSHTDSSNLYLAASLYNDRGWAAYNPSQVRQLFGKYSTYGDTWELGASVAYADNLLHGNQTVPLSMLGNAAQGYSHPDYTDAQNISINLHGLVQADASNTYNGNIYYRHLSRNILNSNIGELLSSSTNDASCLAHSPVDCPASNLLAQYTQKVVGSNLQWTHSSPLWTLPQSMTVGLNAELSRTRFDNLGTYATVGSDNGTQSVGDTLSQASITSRNQRLGFFATSTLDATDRLAITASARYDYATVRLAGESCIDDALCDSTASIASGQVTDVQGRHTYRRLNPSLGASYQLQPQLTAFANYAEGFRTPSAIELACADPAAPCSGIPNAFGADPELAAVVSKTIELGLRGQLADQLHWRTAYFRSMLHNDILFNQSSLTTGYFSNVGKTLRQGVELGVDGRHFGLDYAVDLDWTQATYQTTFQTANPSNSAAATLVQPGNRIPGIPALLFKARLGYKLNPTTRLGLTVLAQGSQYARGDENNADSNGRLPGFATVKLDVAHAVQKNVKLYAGVHNLFNTQYANHGMLGVNNLSTGAAEQFRSLGAPRSIYVGVQALF
jgi:iron complex outermembrane receptor protein